MAFKPSGDDLPCFFLEAIEEFMQAWNHNPKPFIWTATVGDIVKKIERARLKMEHIKPGSTLPRGKKTATKL